MRELSLHVLDIAQNSLAAGATCVTLWVHESGDWLEIGIADNGHGMTPEQLAKIRDPFYTTRTTRPVGMGIPLFRMVAEMTGGTLTITSEVDVGTTVIATFGLSHIDRLPLGDMNATVGALIRMNPQLDFIYRRRVETQEFLMDTRELRTILGEVSLAEPEVISWIEAYMNENTAVLGGQA